jgi:hypothetical protein
MITKVLEVRINPTNLHIHHRKTRITCNRMYHKREAPKYLTYSINTVIADIFFTLRQNKSFYFYNLEYIPFPPGTCY